MQLALLLFDVDPIAVAPEVEVARPDGERVGTGELVRQSLARDWERFAGAMGHGVGTIAHCAVQAARHPLTSVNEVVETALSIGRTVAPVRATLSPLMTERGLDRRLDMLEIDLADLKRAARAPTEQ